MALVHTVGIFVMLVGLGLFTLNEIKARQDIGTSQVQAWKLNISGPPALVLVVVGILVFIFPFTSLWPTPEPEQALPLTVPDETTTTIDFSASTTTTASLDFPLSPYDYNIVYEPDICGGDMVEWFTDESVAGWWTVVDIYDWEDNYLESYEFDSNDDARTFPYQPRLCQWEFYTGDNHYWIYVYSYNEANYSEDALVIEYP